MRTRAAVLVASVTAALLAGAASASGGVSDQQLAIRAGAGRTLEAPRPAAFVRRLPVRVVVRVPTQTSRLRVRVGRRDVTRSFRRARGSLRVARLTRRNGLRYGRNRLFVLAERRGSRPVVDARSFVLARRYPGLVRLRVRTGPVTSLSVRVAGKSFIAPEHFRQRGEVERRLSVIRRSRTARLWLNGRPITRVLDRSQPTRWTAELSATHGLRHGVNRLRLFVAEPDSGRYVELRRRFRVRRDRHLAAAGWDVATTVGGRVRLDGRRSRLAGRGRARHSWSIVAKPPGSHAVLRRAGTARPLLTPDRPGRYVVRLGMTGRTGRARASQVTSTSADRLIVKVRPNSLLVPFKALTFKNGHPGIQVGDTFYRNPDPGSVQWLTLDRATLTPTGRGNSRVDQLGEGLDALATALSKGTNDQLVILSSEGTGWVFPEQVDRFNKALKMIGAGPIDKAALWRYQQPFAVVGVPYGGEGNGWSTLRGEGALTGWLMPDATTESDDAVHFRFQPERPAFATSSSKTSTTNTMLIRDQQVTASLPAGQTGGFQVVELDPYKFTVVRSDVFGYNGQLEAMAARLDQIRTSGTGYIAVQSIGSVAGFQRVGSALAKFGANPHTFNSVGTSDGDRGKGSYAFLGGSGLERSEVVDSSSAVVVDAGERESGTVSGRMGPRADGYFAPVAASPGSSFESPLYDIVFQDPKPWPYTCAKCDPDNPGALVDVAAYKRALADITAKLPDLKQYYPDLRQAYVSDDTLEYTHSHVFLANLRYPGDGRTCAEGPGPTDPSKPAFTSYTREQFCNLSDELALEFDWLDYVRDRFETYETVLTRSNGLGQANLEAIGRKVQEAVKPPKGTAFEILTDIGNYILGGLEAIPEVDAAVAAASAVFEFATSLASDLEDDKPLSDQIKAKVDDLASEVAERLFSSVNAMDRVRDVVNSDYGRLKALASLEGWRIDRPALAKKLTDAANAFFSSQIMPVAYGVYALVHGKFATERDPENCRDGAYGYTWRGAPASAQMEWLGGYDLDGYKKDRGRFILGQHSLSLRYYAYPPATLADQMFRPWSQDGYGVRLPDFVWEQYKPPPGKQFPPTDIGQCLD